MSPFVRRRDIIIHADIFIFSLTFCYKGQFPMEIISESCKISQNITNFFSKMALKGTFHNCPHNITDIKNNRQNKINWCRIVINTMGYNFYISSVYQFIFTCNTVSERLLMPNEQCSAISWWEHIIFHEIMMMSALYQTNVISWIFIVLAHWNYSLLVDMSLHSDTLSRFQTIQFLLLLLNAACLAEKQQMPIL